MAGKVFNWGIIGLGKIARKMADDLRLLPNVHLHAVASTDLERALSFAADYGATHAYGAYQDITDCPGLDVVYIATPHPLHYELTMMCLEKGIPVLCEKPFSMNLRQTEAMIALARERKVFLMEALWSFFIPGVAAALEMARNGEIGTIHSAKADFGYFSPYKPDSRIHNRSLGGGSLLDIGIYPLLLFQSIFGAAQPDQIQASAILSEEGVDESCAFIIKYPEHKMAMGHSSIAAWTPVEAAIYGSTGVIQLHSRWHFTQQISVQHYGKNEAPEQMDFPFEGWGYRFEAEHVMECLEKGLRESPVVPLSFTLQLTETLDVIREKIGLRYPEDEADL